MKNILFVIILVCCSSILLKGQTSHVNVFPDLTGQSLLIELRNWYKTNKVYDYSTARDTLFGKIDMVGDSLECIYTGMKLYIGPGQDPTEAVYLNGISNGINCEHSYPQGKGAIGQAQSDMHHLYPSRIKANSDRGDFPYSDIPDNQTKTWYYKTTERSTPPAIGLIRDQYSEGVNGRFEPRESSKGNIARSIFYFYTMYKAEADGLDPAFFEIQKATLCEWHNQDPVDKREWDRNQNISKHQGNKLNPFVLDCSLVSRAYCNNIDQACEAIILSSVDFVEKANEHFMSVYPNPGYDDDFLIAIHSPLGGKCRIEVRQMTGAIITDVMKI
ncbi:MAG: endonuclease [Saprospiraceae bacterium]|nr:endonuclease [Saprospiraceae bacterium]